MDIYIFYTLNGLFFIKKKNKIKLNKPIYIAFKRLVSNEPLKLSQFGLVFRTWAMMMDNSTINIFGLFYHFYLEIDETKTHQ